MTKKNPSARPYPTSRAPRVDRSRMTEEEWAEHLKKKNREKAARYNEKNPGLTNGKLRKRRAENPWYSPLLAAGWRSRERRLEHDLTQAWALSTYTGVCSMTDIPFVIATAAPAGKSGLRPYSPSIDRINPLRGYTQDNCRWVLSAINSFKGEMSDAEMYHLAAALLATRPVN